MEKDGQKYGYSFEDQVAWKSEQEELFAKRGYDFDPDAAVNEPEDYMMYKSGPTAEENAFDLSVLNAQLEQRREERKKREESFREFEIEKELEKTQLERYERMKPYERLVDALMTYGKYLSKNKNNSNDIDLSQKIFNAISHAREGNFETMENLFLSLNERAKTDPDLSFAVPEWENNFNQWKHSVEEKQTNSYRKAAENYKNHSFFRRLISRLNGEKINDIGNGKKR